MNEGWKYLKLEDIHLADMKTGFSAAMLWNWTALK
jgi:hypothetical protein